MTSATAQAFAREAYRLCQISIGKTPLNCGKVRFGGVVPAQHTFFSMVLTPSPQKLLKPTPIAAKRGKIIMVMIITIILREYLNVHKSPI
jgi:hypothetical protein